MQVRARTLQQELGDLKTATKQADIAFKGDISSLKGQLEASLADCTDALDQKHRLEVTLADSHKEISSLKGLMGSACAGSAKELSSVKGQLLQALADSAKETSRLREQLETALAASRDVHQQEEKAFMAGRAAMVCLPACESIRDFLSHMSQPPHCCQAFAPAMSSAPFC